MYVGDVSVTDKQREVLKVMSKGGIMGYNESTETCILYKVGKKKTYSFLENLDALKKLDKRTVKSLISKGLVCYKYTYNPIEFYGLCPRVGKFL